MLSRSIKPLDWFLGPVGGAEAGSEAAISGEPGNVILACECGAEIGPSYGRPSEVQSDENRRSCGRPGTSASPILARKLAASTLPRPGVLCEECGSGGLSIREERDRLSGGIVGGGE